MNQKNSLGLNNCFQNFDDPIQLFDNWMKEAKKSEPNDPNAVALATANKNNFPSVRMVLLKNFNQNGFVFYTNLESQKGNDLKENPNVAMCFHWKSLLRQIRVSGTVSLVLDGEKVPSVMFIITGSSSSGAIICIALVMVANASVSEIPVLLSSP